MLGGNLHKGIILDLVGAKERPLSIKNLLLKWLNCNEDGAFSMPKVQRALQKVSLCIPFD